MLATSVTSFVMIMVHKHMHNSIFFKQNSSFKKFALISVYQKTVNKSDLKPGGGGQDNSGVLCGKLTAWLAVHL